MLSVIVLTVHSAPGLHRRNRRSLGLIKLGYNTLVGDRMGGFLDGVWDGVGDAGSSWDLWNDLSTMQKIGVSIPIAKAVGLGLVGKCEFKYPGKILYRFCN